MRNAKSSSKATFELIRVHGKELELDDSGKLLGTTITSDLPWNIHTYKRYNQKDSQKAILFSSAKKGRREGGGRGPRFPQMT